MFNRKTILLYFLLLLGFSAFSQKEERIKYVDSLLHLKNWKILKHLTSKNENHISYAYTVNNINSSLWCIIEQRLVSDGFESSKTARFIFDGEDLLAIIVIPRYKNCKKCMNIYYFSDNTIVYKKEETKPENLDELLALSREYRAKRPLVRE